MQDISLEKAVAVLQEQAAKVRDVEEVPLMEALGRTLAEDYTAPFANPPFDRSPLDGYTFAARGTEGATQVQPARLRIIGEECAGQYFDQPVPEEGIQWLKNLEGIVKVTYYSGTNGGQK